jgi:hypothetical protein
MNNNINKVKSASNLLQVNNLGSLTSIKIGNNVNSLKNIRDPHILQTKESVASLSHNESTNNMKNKYLIRKTTRSEFEMK